MSQVKYALSQTNNKKLFKCTNGGINISDIPEEILSKIMSFCTLRDAVSTSMLSRIWRRVSFSMPVLSFNLKSMFLTENEDSDVPPHCLESTGWMYKSCVEYKERFVRWVNQFIVNHEGPRLVSLKVEFCLGRDNACDIDRWVTTAISLGAEQVTLLFSCSWNFIGYWKKVDLKKLYIFRFELLYQAEAPKLEYLSLHSCVLELGRINQFCCLKNLLLSEVPLGPGEVQGIVSCFTNLEHWTMANCILPEKLHIPSSFQRLKFLSVTHCLGVKEFDVSAAGLTSFEYFGKRVRFSFYSVPNLRKVYLGSYERVDEGTYHFQSSANFPFVETLSIYCNRYPVGRLPVCVTHFTNLKELELFSERMHVGTNPEIIDILQSFPLLEKLHLVISFLYELMPKRKELVPMPQPFQPIHKNLKEILISSFCAKERCIELVLSLLAYAPSLEQMVLDVQHKVYLGADRWVECNGYLSSWEDKDELYIANIYSRLRGHRKSSVVVLLMDTMRKLCD